MRLATRILSLALAALALLPAAVGATAFAAQRTPGSSLAFLPQRQHTSGHSDLGWTSEAYPTMGESAHTAWTLPMLGSYVAMPVATITKTNIYAALRGTRALHSVLTPMPLQGFNPTLSLFPNPARGQLTVQLSAQVGPDYKLRLSNVLGREVRLLPLPLATAASGLPLDVTGLPAGLYFCSLLVNDKAVSTNRLTLL
ncbi:hypothetical protein A0257_17875 [Hymenobacter psoromatis]|nr:hypothetical protein A0257_17875 [Hymenobacter psoromatis]